MKLQHLQCVLAASTAVFDFEVPEKIAATKRKLKEEQENYAELKKRPRHPLDRDASSESKIQLTTKLLAKKQRVIDAVRQELAELQSGYDTLKQELEGGDGKKGLRSEFDLLAQKETEVSRLYNSLRKEQEDLAPERKAQGENYANLSLELTSLKEKYYGKDGNGGLLSGHNALVQKHANLSSELMSLEEKSYRKDGNGDLLSGHNALVQNHANLSSDLMSLKEKYYGKGGNVGLLSEHEYLKQKHANLSAEHKKLQGEHKELEAERDELRAIVRRHAGESTKIQNEVDGKDGLKAKLKRLKKEVEGDGGLRSGAAQWDALAQKLQEDGGSIAAVGDYHAAMQAVMRLREQVVDFVRREEGRSDGPCAQLLHDNTTGDADGARNILRVLEWALLGDIHFKKLMEKLMGIAEALRQERDQWRDAAEAAGEKIADQDRVIAMLREFIEKEV